MTKVYVLMRCTVCEGQAYFPLGEAESHTGEKYMRYVPCAACQGSGQAAKWVSMREFLDLLDAAATIDPMEPNYLKLAQKEPNIQDSREAAGI